MRNKQNKKKKAYEWRLSTLVFLVLFVFVILLVSILAAAGIVLLLNRFHLLSDFGDNTLLAFLAFVLLVSLTIGIILTFVLGNLFLSPLHKLNRATKEVAAGNFDVRVEAKGTDELKRLSTSFNEMAQELGSIETLRNEFVGDISHEFKTPVVSIRGFARLLKRGNLTPAQQEEYLDIIIEESQRLSQLSSNVLLLSRLDNTGHLSDLETFSLDEQLRRCLLLLEPQITAKQLKLCVDLVPAELHANEELLQQVWVNLLNNAVQYTPEGGEIRVRLLVDGTAATVQVEDTGIGMDEEVLRHLFDKFYQGDRSRTSQGNGLGLSLVKRILDLNHGQIAVRSQPGEGSVFTVTFCKN